MYSVTIIILNAFLLPGLAKDLVASHMSEDQVDMLVDKLVDKLLGTSAIPNLAKTRALTPGLNRAQTLASLPGPSALKNMVFNQIQAHNGRCVSVKADAAEFVGNSEPLSKEKVQDMAGVTAPLGFFDPMGISTNVPEGKLLFYREAELKHGRVCMLAILGLIVGDRHDFIPLLGEGIPSDTPAYMFGTPFVQDTNVAQFWPVALGAMAIEEFRRAQIIDMGRISQSSDVAPGDYGFDPLGMKPTDPKGLKELQNKELNNGRLAMFATAGYIFQQQAVTHGKIWPFS